MSINLQSKEFEDARLNTFSELPDGTMGVGKDRSYMPIRNPVMSWWNVNEDDVLLEFKEYMDIFPKVYDLDKSRVSFYYHRIVDEICIQVDGRWSGYLDHYLITELLVEAKERNIEIC